MTIKRLQPDDSDSFIIMLIYREAKKHAHDGQWRRYDSVIRFREHEYHIVADFVLRDAFFTYRNLEIEKLNKIITLN